VRHWWISLLLLSIAGCDSRQADTGLQQSIYVWQQNPSQELFAAVDNHGHRFHSLYALAYRVDVRGETIEMEPAAALQVCLRVAAGQRILPVIRIDAPDAGLGEVHRLMTEIAERIPEMERAFEAAGSRLTEIEIDYPCPLWLLGEYAELLHGLDAHFPPISFSFTAQPEWIGADGWEALTDAADFYTLELHGIDLPPHPVEEFVMFDPEEAREAVRMADADQGLFRIALPAYSSQVAQSGDGRILDVGREPEFAPPAEASRVIRVDPPVESVADFVRFLNGNPPSHMMGIVWFRLPRHGDNLTWSVDGLTEVMRGRLPDRGLELLLEESGPGVYHIYLENIGDLHEPLPARISLEGALGNVISFDSFDPYSFSTEGSPSLILKDHPENARLAPDTKLELGWLRSQGNVNLNPRISPTGN